jgi:hypothetical protein
MTWTQAYNTEKKVKNIIKRRNKYWEKWAKWEADKFSFA